MSQGDSIYDFVDRRDHAAWKTNLNQAGRAINLAHVGRRYDSSDRHRTTTTVADCSHDRAFYCRMYRARNCRRLPPACTEHKVCFSSFVVFFTSDRRPAIDNPLYRRVDFLYKLGLPVATAHLCDAGMLRPRGQPGLEAKLCGLGLTMVGLGLIR